MSLIPTRKLVLYKIASIADPIPVGRDTQTTQSYLFSRDGEVLRANTILLDPGIYVPSVRDLTTGQEFFVDAISGFSGTGATLLNKTDPILGTIRVIQVVAERGAKVQLAGQLILKPEAVFVEGSDPVEGTNIAYVGIAPRTVGLTWSSGAGSPVLEGRPVTRLSLSPGREWQISYPSGTKPEGALFRFKAGITAANPIPTAVLLPTRVELIGQLSPQLPIGQAIEGLAVPVAGGEFITPAPTLVRSLGSVKLNGGDEYPVTEFFTRLLPVGPFIRSVFTTIAQQRPDSVTLQEEAEVDLVPTDVGSVLYTTASGIGVRYNNTVPFGSSSPFPLPSVAEAQAEIDAALEWATQLQISAGPYTLTR